MNSFNNFYVIDHPLIKHKLALLRDKTTGNKIFRELVTEITSLITFNLTKNLPVSKIHILTPLTKTTGHSIKGQDIVIVPILRAGLGMLEGILQLIPTARVGYAGTERDETTHMPVHYYFKIPTYAEKRYFIIIDPMLATGGTSIATVDSLKKYGAKHIKFMCLIAAPEGVEAFCTAHPDVEVYSAGLDDYLDENKYIVPGLGDAGDRLFGTK